MSSKRTKDNKAVNHKSGRLFSLFLRQVIAAFICVAFALGMKYCGNDRLSSYADSLGLAIRQHTDWNITSTSVFSWFEDKLSPLFDFSSNDNSSNPNDDAHAPTPVTDEITFQ